MAEQTMQTSASPTTRWGRWLIGGALYLALLATGLSIGGELSVFVSASLNVLPFVGLATFAYFASQRLNWAWIVSGLWLVLLIGVITMYAAGITMAVLLNFAPNNLNPPDPSDPAFLTRLQTANIPGLMLSFIGVIGISSLLLIPAIRRATARFIPIDPSSWIHTVALITVISVTLIMFIPLFIVGEPPLLMFIRQTNGEVPSELSDEVQLRAQIYSLIWNIPAALLAVGFGIRRNLAETLTRLGLVRPTLSQLAISAGAGLVMAVIVYVGMPFQLSLWQMLGWPMTDHESFAKLLAFALSPIGAVVVGVTAGLGEELAIRGVLQPRMGLWLSNLFFTSLHAFQYHWDALLIVFAVGLVCGIIRNRFNTTTAAIVHGVYNCTLILLTITFV